MNVQIYSDVNETIDGQNFTTTPIDFVTLTCIDFFEDMEIDSVMIPCNTLCQYILQERLHVKLLGSDLPQFGKGSSLEYASKLVSLQMSDIHSSLALLEEDWSNKP